MKKYLVRFEFRYEEVNKTKTDYDYRNKYVTIGVYDTIEEAIENGNKSLEIFEKHFKLNPHWNRKDRFSKNGGCFSSANTLVTNLAYLQTPFDFYGKIETLTYFDLEQTILEVTKATEELRDFKNN